MPDSPIEGIIKNVARCVLCDAPLGKCTCWQKCKVCGWSHETGKACRNCAGDKTPRVIASGSMRFPREK